jgi:HSP20 family molecular chaperone IbpA
MSNGEVNDGLTGIQEPQPASFADAPRPLLALLVELVQGLGQVRDDLRAIEAERLLVRWDGGGYTYLEAVLPGIVATGIDINVHGGRVFVRMERVPEGALASDVIISG